MAEFSKKFREDLMPLLFKIFNEIESNLIPCITLDTKTREGSIQEREPQANLSNENIYKILNKILAKRMAANYQQDYIHHEKVEFIPGMQGWFHTCKSINVITPYQHSHGQKSSQCRKSI